MAVDTLLSSRDMAVLPKVRTYALDTSWFISTRLTKQKDTLPSNTVATRTPTNSLPRVGTAVVAGTSQLDAGK